PDAWVTADAVYGSDSAFRKAVEGLGLGYVAVRTDHAVCVGLRPRRGSSVLAGGPAGGRLYSGGGGATRVVKGPRRPGPPVGGAPRGWRAPRGGQAIPAEGYESVGRIHPAAGQHLGQQQEGGIGSVIGGEVPGANDPIPTDGERPVAVGAEVGTGHGDRVPQG